MLSSYPSMIIVYFFFFFFLLNLYFIACSPPPRITHGLDINPTSSFFPYGYRMKYSCAAGLSLIGDESIYCTSEDGVNLD